MLNRNWGTEFRIGDTTMLFRLGSTHQECFHITTIAHVRLYHQETQTNTFHSSAVHSSADCRFPIKDSKNWQIKHSWNLFQKYGKNEKCLFLVAKRSPTIIDIDSRKGQKGEEAKTWKVLNKF